MRELADEERIRRFMQELGRRSRDEARVYFADGVAGAESFHRARGEAQLPSLRPVRPGARQGRARAVEYFDAIEPELFRFPAINPAAFGRQVELIFRGA